MIQHHTLEHRFVAYFPDFLVPGILYVSLDYGSVAHRCCCGCGEEVVTPLTPTDWHIIYDGEAVTLHPSVGNWTLPCRSHYVIRRGQVIEAPSWSEAQIRNERDRDHRAKQSYFATQSTAPDISLHRTIETTKTLATTTELSWINRLRRWWHG